VAYFAGPLTVKQKTHSRLANAERQGAGVVDLIVCVGENCHLNGSEEVVRCFQRLLAAPEFVDRVTLKGSFCVGSCSQGGEVTIRLADEFFHTRYQAAEACFRDQIQPRLAALLAAG
jgi:NADH:ubiquinone oxidoreductase subunit E